MVFLSPIEITKLDWSNKDFLKGVLLIRRKLWEQKRLPEVKELGRDDESGKGK